MRSPAMRGPAARVRALRILLLIPFLGLAARATHLSLGSSRSAQAGEGQVHTSLALPAARGLIVDRKGVELAVSLDAPSIYALPDALSDRATAIPALAEALGLRPREIRERLRGRGRFTFLARWVDRERADRVVALKLPGIGMLRESRRAYPNGALAAHVLGFANIDGVGVRGIEQQEDAWLRGKPRRVPVERDGGGRLLASVPAEVLDAAGGDVALTLDAVMQAAAERALRDAVARSGARAGMVVTIDPDNGDILALAEAPSFDPNHFREVRYQETRSRAFLDALEPGSTLKVFLVAAALEAGVVHESDFVDCREQTLRVPGKTIRDRRAFGMLSVGDVLRVSSNIGAVRIAERLPPAQHHAALTRFGFGHQTGSGFPVESSGLMRHWKGWAPVDRATVAFGQGINVTAVQLAAATAALANGGTWIRPRLVAARRTAKGPWQPTPVERVRRVVSRHTAGSVLAMMETVVSPGGTGTGAALQGVRVAGKTGTAQKLDRATGTYANDRYVAWFIGAVPAQAPRLVIVVALDEPRIGSHTGGTSAAPLFAKVAAAQLSRLGIATAPEAPRAAQRMAKRAKTNAPVRRSPEAIAIPAQLGDRLLVPDFRGLSVQAVMQITSNSSIELHVDGRGRAVSQEPLPGTILPRSGGRVRVHFIASRQGEG